MTGAGAVSVLVADDHPLFREAVANVVRMSSELSLVAEVTTGREALDAIVRLAPAVAVLDVRMGGFGGLDVALALVERGSRTRIVLLSAFPGAGLLDRNPQAHDIVAGYLTKDASAVFIRRAILMAARGEHLSDVRSATERSAARTGLSARELEILSLTAAGQSAPMIGRQLMLSPTTVKSHLQNTYAKLGVADRAAAVAEGMRRGLLE